MEKRLAGGGDRKPVCLVDARPVSIGLCVRRAQVDLRGCDVGGPKFLPQGFDVNTVLMPPRGVQHAKGMAGFLNLVTSIVCLAKLGDSLAQARRKVGRVEIPSRRFYLRPRLHQSHC
jgi:hypothetical protein